MRFIRRTLIVSAVIMLTYAIVAWMVGPLNLAHFFITITAIDKWHPNWPDPATVDSIASNLPSLALFVGVFCLVLNILLSLVRPRIDRLTNLSDPLLASSLITTYNPTREEFHAALCEGLRDAGISARDAVDATDAAMAAHATSDTPADWAGTVRAEALNLAGLPGTYLRVHSREAHLEDTARFLTNYGYPALRVHRIGSLNEHEHEMNFNGIAVQHRTPARDAEESLIELLIVAHQAHMASMSDDGSHANAGKVQRYAEGLRYVATKLALRGFVPPELDAQVGRDGIATADELEQWAIAQVVAACSPMARMPLSTIERTIEDSR